MSFRSTRLRALALFVTTGVLATLGITVLAAPASAGPIGSCANLKSFTLVFRTGGDDLRGNSELIPFLQTPDGDLELQHAWGGFGGNSTHSRSLTFFNPNWAVNSCSVTGIKLRMISHPEWHEGPDNWNMDGISVYGYSATGSYRYYHSNSGSPLKRFTGSDQWWSSPPA